MKHQNQCMMTWNAICQHLNKSGVLQAAWGIEDSLPICQVTHDSRRVVPGGVFVATRGQSTDGHAFMEHAAQRMAAAIVCETLPDRSRFPGVAFAQVRDARKALAVIAAIFCGSAHRKLKLYGVTGTNGKTTTCYLLHHVLSVLDGLSGMLGTIEYCVGDVRIASSLTTPDALQLHGLFRRMAAAGCTSCVVEVSSHALEQGRVWGVDFHAGIFTNLTLDHLDYHETLAFYRASKKRMFQDLSSEAVAIFNVDDPAGAWMVDTTAARPISYGKSSAADIRFRILEDTAGGLRLRLDGGECTCTMAGAFNGYNIAAAYAAARSAGFSASSVTEALSSAPQVPGRFERMRCLDGTVVVVDYAHTPDALEKALSALQRSKPGGASLWCVFGCGGERDRRKRPMMGRIAETLADHVVVTSDNRRLESQRQIFSDIRAGMEYPRAARWIEDRRQAVHEVVQQAAAGDVVLIAGRGHEATQIDGSCTRDMDDRLEAQRALEQRGTACSTT